VAEAKHIFSPRDALVVMSPCENMPFVMPPWENMTYPSQSARRRSRFRRTIALHAVKHSKLLESWLVENLCQPKTSLCLDTLVPGVCGLLSNVAHVADHHRDSVRNESIDLGDFDCRDSASDGALDYSFMEFGSPDRFEQQLDHHTYSNDNDNDSNRDRHHGNSSLDMHDEIQGCVVSAENFGIYGGSGCDGGHLHEIQSGVVSVEYVGIYGGSVCLGHDVDFDDDDSVQQQQQQQHLDLKQQLNHHRSDENDDNDNDSHVSQQHRQQQQQHDDDDDDSDDMDNGNDRNRHHGDSNFNIDRATSVEVEEDLFRNIDKLVTLLRVHLSRFDAISVTALVPELSSFTSRLRDSRYG
jgi:hypothetical protein